MQNLTEKEVLFRCDKIDVLVQPRFRKILETYHWLSLKVYAEGDKIYGRKKGIWYSLETILRLLERQYSPRYEHIMSQVQLTDSCWIWKGQQSNGCAILITSKHKHSMTGQPAQYVLFTLIFRHKPDRMAMSCCNTLCMRPSHMIEENMPL